MNIFPEGKIQEWENMRNKSGMTCHGIERESRIVTTIVVATNGQDVGLQEFRNFGLDSSLDPVLSNYSMPHWATWTMSSLDKDDSIASKLISSQWPQNALKSTGFKMWWDSALWDASLGR